jgi:hypothetical protein
MTGTLRTSLVSGLLAAVLASCDGHAAEPVDEPGRIELDTTVISGNQELPKVLYIVPWQAPADRPQLPAPDIDADDGLFRRLQPATHQRELLYLDNLPGRSPKE